MEMKANESQLSFSFFLSFYFWGLNFTHDRVMECSKGRLYRNWVAPWVLAVALQKMLSSGFFTSSIGASLRVNPGRLEVCLVPFRLNNNREVAFNSVETSFLATKATGS